MTATPASNSGASSARIATPQRCRPGWAHGKYPQRTVLMSKGLTKPPSLQVSTRVDQRRLLRWLSTAFKLACRIEHKTTGRSKAYIKRNVLVLSDTSGLGPLSVCLHEFAHLLAEREHPGHGHRHGRYFRETLLTIIETVGMNPKDYPWRREYKSINAWARARFGRPPTVSASIRPSGSRSSSESTRG